MGTYDLKIEVTDTLTGLVNEQNVFTCTVLQPNYATSLAYITSTLIADFTYLLGDPEVIKDAPSFTVSPVDADV